MYASDSFDILVWKEKYEIDWCHHCDIAIITCPECKNTSCNAGGCDSCSSTFQEFAQSRRKVEHYLTPEEVLIYHKSLRIRKFILDALGEGVSSIDFKDLEARGKMSKYSEQLFAKELGKT